MGSNVISLAVFTLVPLLIGAFAYYLLRDFSAKDKIKRGKDRKRDRQAKKEEKARLAREQKESSRPPPKKSKKQVMQQVKDAKDEQVREAIRQKERQEEGERAKQQQIQFAQTLHKQKMKERLRLERQRARQNAKDVKYLEHLQEEQEREERRRKQEDDEKQQRQEQELELSRKKEADKKREEDEASEWSADEHRLLEAAMRNVSCFSSQMSADDRWDRIAAQVPGRSRKQCISRFKYVRKQLLEMKQQKELEESAPTRNQPTISKYMEEHSSNEDWRIQARMLDLEYDQEKIEEKLAQGGSSDTVMEVVVEPDARGTMISLNALRMVGVAVMKIDILSLQFRCER